jgi:hypothetical protein
VVAVVLPTSGYTAEALAVFIVELVNDNQRNGEVMADALATLELFLEEGRLTFTSEQAADVVASRIQGTRQIHGILHAKERMPTARAPDFPRVLRVRGTLLKSGRT